MIAGIGVDILKIERIAASLPFEDPFVIKTFTKNEVEEAGKRSDPVKFFASRFACKEAVFKCLKIDGNHIRLKEIEVLTSETGSPYVVLSGDLKRYAKERGIENLQVSLSYEEGYAIAFALAQTM